MQTGLTRKETGFIMVSSEQGSKHYDSGKNQEISWEAERLLASQQGLRGIKLHSIAGSDRQKLTNRKQVNIFQISSAFEFRCTHWSDRRADTLYILPYS